MDNEKKDSIVNYYKLARAQIVHEDNLINNRTNWHLAAQGFLFAAFGVLIRSGSSLLPKLKFLIHVIPCVGISLAFLTLFSVLGAVVSMSIIIKNWKSVSKETPSVYTYVPLLMCKNKIARMFGFIAPIFIPQIFIAAWIVIWIKLGELFAHLTTAA